jgi:DNA-binding transcriptional LysR family regulator
VNGISNIGTASLTARDLVVGNTDSPLGSILIRRMDAEVYLVHYLFCNHLYLASKRMELRHLRYFVVVAEELSFTRAARRLHIAIPPLSIQIRNLEKEIGTGLVVRDGRGLRLTSAGRVLLDQARKTLAEANQCAPLARQAANGEIGQLSIGYNAPAEFRVFPRIVPAFRKKWPAVHLVFHRLETAQIVERLRRHEIDLGFVCLPIPTDELEVQELAEDPLVALIPKGHRLATAASIAVKDLSGEPLVLFPRPLDPESYAQIEQLFLRAGATMSVRYELESSLSMINFVAMGIGCAFLPDYARRIRVDGVVYKPLQPRQMVKTLAIVKKRGDGDLAEVFFRFASEYLATPDAKAAAR